MRRRLIALALLSLSTSTQAQDWPGWRGPTGDGIAPDQDAPLTWSQDENVKWKTPLAQPGNGSPIVSNGRIFLTMPEDEAGKGRSLYCFDRNDGTELWSRTVAFDREMPTHKTNPHCSTTPVTDGKSVVVWHASAGLYCYDFEGEELWHRDLGEFKHQWGHGTSPILHGDHIILQTGPGEDSFVAAFSLETGKTIWKTPEPSLLTPDEIEKKRIVGTWCTPQIQHVGERDLILCAQPTRVVAYDAATGSIIWTCSGLSCPRGDMVYSSPVVAGDLCLIQAGYDGPSLGVRLDGEGDVTETHRVWYRPDEMSNCGSGVYIDGAIYLPDMSSVMHCLDAATGEVTWKTRIGRGNTWGSLVAVGERLYLMNQRGTTYVFAPDPTELVLLAENELGEETNATPAVSDGEIFLRTHENLYCIAEGE